MKTFFAALAALLIALTFAPPSSRASNGSNPATLPYLPTSSPFIAAIDNQFIGPVAAFQMATGDFNEDGKTDIVMVQFGVQLLLSNGDGTFTVNNISNFPTLSFDEPVAVAVGDLNHDNHLDLVVVAVDNNFTPALFIALGNGDGTFQNPSFVSMGNECPYPFGPFQVTIADFNGDGNADWIVSCPALTIYFGDGHGRFSSSRELLGTGPIVSSDFNGDGFSDYAAVVGNGTEIFLGSRAGTFSRVKTSLPSVTPILAGDFNEDGKPDLITQPLDGSDSILYFGNRDGTFERGPPLPISVASPFSFTYSPGVVGDFNGDGHLDIACVVYDISTITGIPFYAGSNVVLFGKGDGTFLASPPYVGGDAPDAFVAADLRADGKLDLVSATVGYGGEAVPSIGVLLGNGDGTFEGAHSVLNGVNTVAVGDFNNDGNLDFVAAKPGTVSVVLGNGDGTFQTPLDFSAGDMQALAVGDFNNDGNLDVVAGTDTQIELYLGDGRGGLKMFSSCQCGIGGIIDTNIPSIGVADFNNDGNLDLAVSNPLTNTIAIDFGDGEGHFTRGPVLQLGSYYPLAASADGEFIHKGGNDTHKGGNDMVTGVCIQECDPTKNGKGTTGLFLNSGNGEFQTVATFPFSIVGQPISVVVGDFNNDGKTDLVVSTLQGIGVFYLFLGNGDGTFQSPRIIASGLEDSALGTDFNGDGNLDLVALGNATPKGGPGNPLISVYFGAGNGTFTASQSIVNAGFSSLGNNIGAIGDFNNDGAPDFLESTTVLHLNSGGTYIQLRANSSPADADAPITLFAHVSESYHGVLMPQPTGSVTFRDLSSFPVRDLAVKALVNGTAEANISSLAPGIHVIAPIYSGDSNFHIHTGSPIKVSINLADSPRAATIVAASTPRFVELLPAGGGFGPALAGEIADRQSSGGNIPTSDVGPRPLRVNRLQLEGGPDVEELVLPGLAIVPSPDNLFGFEGLNSADSHAVGNNPDVEPPDQGLGVSNSQVVEAVNDAVALYDKRGNLLSGPIALNRFFGLPDEDPSTPGGTYGPFLSDPRVLFDTDTQRWFVTAIEVITDPSNGNLLPQADVLIAASTREDGSKPFKVFKVDITDTGFGTCPCLGDHPNIATNRDGLFITTNQYSFVDQSFQSAVLLALNKFALARGVAPLAAGFQDLSAYSANAFALMPSQAAPVDSSATATEYFLSSADQITTGNQQGTANTITVWALSDTTTLASPNPFLTLQAVTLNSQTYAQPIAAVQGFGPTPLRDTLEEKCHCSEPFERLDQDDDRVQAVAFSQGNLFGVLNTSVYPAAGKQQSGVAWFSIKPTMKFGKLSSRIRDRGYISLNEGDLLYPAVALNAQSQGAITFSLSGSTMFPGVGYVKIENGRVGDDIAMAATGVAPEDGFTGYLYYGGNGTARWGDYSAATIDPEGKIWFAGEYIQGTVRTELANWGTFIGMLNTR